MKVENGGHVLAALAVATLVSGALGDLSLWPMPVSVTSGRISACYDDVVFATPECESGRAGPVRQRLHALRARIKDSGRRAQSTLTVHSAIADCAADLQFGLDESYVLNITTSGNAYIVAPNQYAAYHAVETFLQTIVPDSSESCTIKFDSIPVTVVDEPRFPWRGLLIDSSRHFLSTSTVLSMVDALAMNKMNVLHWHIVDAISFPLQSERAPLLAVGGAYKYPEATYTLDDVAAVVDHGNEVGVRVVLELDMPGHAYSWGVGYPDITANCPDYAYNPNNIALDPSQNATYEVITGLLTDVREVTTDLWLHTGGDEVVFSCWFSDPDISAWASKEGLTTGEEILNYFEQRLDPILYELGFNRIVWQEVFNYGVNLNTPGFPIDNIVQVWKDSTTLAQILDAGNKGLMSFGWYLDQQIPSTLDPPTTYYEYEDTWQDFYTLEPTTGISSDSQSLLLGGEACMWGETVDDYSIFPRIWPRTSAAAERLWSPEKVNSVDEATPRLSDQACRMSGNGIPSAQIEPRYCPNFS